MEESKGHGVSAEQLEELKEKSAQLLEKIVVEGDGDKKPVGFMNSCE